MPKMNLPNSAQRKARARCVQAALTSFNTPVGRHGTMSATSGGAKQNECERTFETGGVGHRRSQERFSWKKINAFRR
jgi:hypothetical protein